MILRKQFCKLLYDGKIQYEVHATYSEDVESLIEIFIFNQELCGATRRKIPRGSFNLATIEQIEIPRNPSMQQLLEELKVTNSKISIFKIL